MSKFFCNGADSECSCPILCADCSSADWTGGTEIKTNADHIRSMTDEELAEFLCGVYDDENCGVYQDECGKFICGITILDYDQYKIADWLKQPYGGDT